MQPIEPPVRHGQIPGSGGMNRIRHQYMYTKFPLHILLYDHLQKIIRIRRLSLDHDVFSLWNYLLNLAYPIGPIVPEPVNF
jgi:hypothetical protein